MKKKSYLTVTDQFCGAGGSSIGAKRVLEKHGGQVAVALNHWKLAIETHETNFPEAKHDCTDISACDPRKYPATDILITSPECTNHSLAKGVKHVKKQMELFNSGKLDPAAERSRATMWDVPRFAEYHKYNIIIVENVVDARKWVNFEAWLMAMHEQGYKHKCVYLNSMFCYPTPQSRDRMYVVFWKKGNKAPNLEFTPPAFCHHCEKNIHAVQCWKNSYKQFGKYKQQYIYACPTCSNIVQPYYYAAFNCIDWSDIGKRIGDRKKALSPNTMKRIQFGLDKYGNQILSIANYSPGYSRPVSDASPTIRTKDSTGVLTPFIVDSKQTTGIDFRVKGINDRMPTVHTQPALGVAMPMVLKMENAEVRNVARAASEALATQTTRQSYALVSPFLVDGNYDAEESRAKSVSEEVQTICTHHRTGITFPFIVENKKKSKARTSGEAISTVTTKPYHGVVTTEAWNSFITYYNGNGGNAHISEGAPTVSTKDRLALVNYEKPKIEDCYYRMLKPGEIKKAMAFHDEYVILGSGKDQVKQLGNAVTPPAMEFLIERCVETLL